MEYTEEDVQPMKARWIFALLSVVVGANPSYYALEQFMIAIWWKIGIPKLYKKDDGVFLFKFHIRR